MHTTFSNLMYISIFLTLCRPVYVILLRNNSHFHKGKGHCRTGHEGPQREQMYSSTISTASELDVGGWSTPRPGRFTSGNDQVPIIQETV